MNGMQNLLCFDAITCDNFGIPQVSPENKNQQPIKWATTNHETNVFTNNMLRKRNKNVMKRKPRIGLMHFNYTIIFIKEQRIYN